MHRIRKQRAKRDPVIKDKMTVSRNAVLLISFHSSRGAQAVVSRIIP